MSNINLAIRNENENDYRTVEEMVRETFWNLYVPGCDEHFILHDLRNSSDFIPELDFVAEKEGQIVGQIVYSRGCLKYTQSTEKEVVSFGPVSVMPTLQKHGIGSGLITHTINLAREMGFPAICIYGDPRYYSRFGFRCAEKYEIKTADGKFAIALQVLELQRGALANMPGRFIESAAFEVDENEFAQYDEVSDVPLDDEPDLYGRKAVAAPEVNGGLRHGSQVNKLGQASAALSTSLTR